MARCPSHSELQVHFRRRDGGNGLANAEVLCRRCRESAVRIGAGEPPPFDDATRESALRLAGYRCECTRAAGCHPGEA